jgi:hypothetical protein
MAIVNQVDVVAAVVALLKTVVGNARVEDRPGGVVTWIQQRRPKVSYWEVDIESIEEESTSARGRAVAANAVRIEGWMPMDYALNTMAAWRPLVDGVRDALRGNRTLSGVASFATLLPKIQEQNLQLVAGGGPGMTESAEIVCHHVKILWHVGQDFFYTSV